MSTSRRHQRETGRCRDRHTRPHPAVASSHLTELGIDVVATRLRTLGHPVRLRILRAIEGRSRTVTGLADELRESVAAVRAHVAVLYRSGVLRRVDEDGRPAYELADWPSMWLVDQLALRLRQRAVQEAEDGAGDEGLSSCV